MNEPVLSQSKSKKMKLWVKVLIGFIIAIGVFWQAAPLYGALFGGPSITDRFTSWGYRAPNEIFELTKKSGMNDNGRFHFYIGQPQLNDSSAFNHNCADVMHAETVVLGCYDGQIYLFDVTDNRLEGVKYVTAAHEMLHVVYERLGSIEQLRVDKLLNEQLEKTTDERILGLVETYDRTEPGQRLNELHSIFATEVRNVNPELEQYYGKYFSDRSRVVTESERYEKIFSELEAKAEELEGQLDNLGAQIDSRKTNYEFRAEKLSADIDWFNSCADTYGCFYNEIAFNSQRNSLLGEQNSLNAEADAINALIEQYNLIAVDLQALGYEVEQLQNSINSRSILE